MTFTPSPATPSLLNDDLNQLPLFSNLDEVMKAFQEESFQALHVRKRFRQVNQKLVDLIQQMPTPSFLLRAVLDYIDRVNQAQLLNEPLTIAAFEFWLNHFSDLSFEDNYKIRGKIVGKYVPREDYQCFFPIGMGKTYNGSHFVAAHLSPDVDTMIASLSGWMDAFAARVGTGLHQWLLPDGPPDSPITTMITELFGTATFPLLARQTPTLTLSARDLLTQRHWIKTTGEKLTGDINNEREDKMVTLVDDHGHYLDDWRSQDFELVRQVIMLFKSPLRWFENILHTQLVALFADPDLSSANLNSFKSSIFETIFEQAEPVRDYNQKQKEQLDSMIRHVLNSSSGIKSTFGHIFQAFENLQIEGLHALSSEISALTSSQLFDSQGKLSEDRPALFAWLVTFLNTIDNSMKNISLYLERLDIAIAIKQHVLGIAPIFLTLNSDVDEMRNKIRNFDFLTVVIYEQDGSLFPVGIIYSADLRKNGLGTVTLRDFSNLEEIKMASYLEVISIVDHHKSTLKTPSVPCALIGDAQSSNVLIAEQTFMMNDRYSLGGVTNQQIHAQISQLSSSEISPIRSRIMKRLFTRQQASYTKGEYFVCPKREAAEYTFFLQAILDDTDLLSKVSNRDIDCIVQLLNRLKSLNGNEVEIIDIDDIPRDKHFAKKAAQRILQNPDMYALYKKTFDFRERDINHNLELCGLGKSHTLFIDTKEQNGCARLGQTKIFHSNYGTLEKNATAIRTAWYRESEAVNKAHPEIDLFIHMMSTIPSADEVYKNQLGTYTHQDEIWIWIPSTQQGRDHLAAFLTNFQAVARPLQKNMSVEFPGDKSQELEHLFQRFFFPIPVLNSPIKGQGLPIAILRNPPGTLNSRKAMFTPCLPRIP